MVVADEEISRLGGIVPQSPVSAPGSALTQCVAQPTTFVVVKESTAVAAARQQVLEDPKAPLACVRSDRARELSIQLVGRPLTDTGATAAVRAGTMAAEVDRIWASLVT